jgi:hypothetical protein
MTATCREACCSVTPRLTVSELFERGFRRNRAAPLGLEGPSCRDAEGNVASFSIDLAGGALAGIGFRATSCATLIAYCEFIAQSVTGFRRDLAQALTAPELIGAVPGVPALKRERAVLAITAFRAALAQTTSD